MARVVYTKLATGSTKEADDLNDPLNAIATESASVESENLREEGLDGTNFATSAMHGTNGSAGNSARTNIAAGVTKKVAELGSVTLDAGQVLEVVGSVEFPTEELRTVLASVYGIGATGDVEVWLTWDNGGGDTLITGSTHQHSAGDTGKQPAGGAIGNHASITTYGILPYSVPLGITGPVAIRLWAKANGAAANFNHANLSAAQFQRVTLATF